jgi:hypothetical protein
MLSMNQDSYTDKLERFLRSNLNQAHIFAFYFAAIFLSAYFMSSILRPEIFTDDMVEWTSWAYTFQDPELFPNDIHKNYWMTNFPLGYEAILKALSPLVDVELLGKLLGFALAGLSSFLAYVLGREITGGKVWGGIANVIFVSLCQFTTFPPFMFIGREAGGLPRGFALTIVLIGVIAALRRDLRWVGGAILLGAIFYPPACISLCSYVALIVIYRLFKERSLPKGSFILASLIAASGGILIYNMLHSAQITGAVYSFSQIVKMPEFHEGGMWPVLRERWSDYIVVDILMLDQGITGVLWIFLLVVLFCFGANNSIQKVRRPEVVFLPISALANYIVANLVLLHLYEPSRYLVFPSQALTLCCFPFVFEAVFNWAAPRFIGVGASGALNKRVLGSSIAVIAIVGVLVFSARLFFNRGGTDPMPKEVYSFLGALPKDTLIAATPVDGDRVPMRSRRSVFIIVNSLYPHHSGYYEEAKQRSFALLAAMYDSGPESLQALRRKYGIRYFVLNRNFTSGDSLSWFQPFKDYLAEFRSKIGGGQPYILGLWNDAAVLQKGDYAVLDLDRLDPSPR